MFLTFVLTNIVLVIIIRVYCWLTCGMCRCSRHLVGKVVIVTGGNAGIGYETAKNMAERGARVILACRSETRGTKARDEIVKLTGNSNVHFRRLDLASFASVRAFAASILSTEKRLDILINNAGMYLSQNQNTEDGLLVSMQVNYFGPFLLTSLLLPLLKSSTPSRIINVSSVAHQRGKIDLDDLNCEKTEFNSRQVFSNSKLCNVIMTIEMNRRLTGSGVTVNCLHPGFVERNPANRNNIGPLKYIALLEKLVTKTTWEGAQTSIYLAVSPEVSELSGRYFRDCFEVSVLKQAHDSELAEKLWKVSETLVKL